MSGDPEREYFATGMVEKMLSALSRIRWPHVLARNSSFTYKGQAACLRQQRRSGVACLGVHVVARSLPLACALDAQRRARDTRRYAKLRRGTAPSEETGITPAKRPNVPDWHKRTPRDVASNRRPHGDDSDRDGRRTG